MKTGKDIYPPLASYAFLSDCHCTALVSTHGSIDWCCMPRVDSDTCFGRLLDWQHGGYCLIAPASDDFIVSRRYIPQTMILETCFRGNGGEAKLTDFFAMDDTVDEQASNELVRIVECISGEIELIVEIMPRFDFGEIAPAIAKPAIDVWTATGSNQGLTFQSDLSFEILEQHSLRSEFILKQGETKGLIISFVSPERIDQVQSPENVQERIADGYESTRLWWQRWIKKMRTPYKLDATIQRSAMVLKALTFERTGAIIAAPTTSLPEWIGASRNWDYRYSWVRDSVFTVEALNELGYGDEALRFLQFIQRASAGSARQLQIMYGVDGKRRLTEMELQGLDGYMQSRPVRIGNLAAKQHQLDIYGEILELASIWQVAGNRIDEHYWGFLTDVVNVACQIWNEPDHGIWEFRGGPRHHVHSKAMCWGALELGIRIVQADGLPAPVEHWQQTRDLIRQTIEEQGYDKRRGIFIQEFGNDFLDSSLLLLPRIGFVKYDDPRMIRTVDAICSELDREGLLLRYNSPDDLPGNEGIFIACTFWLVNCLAYQGRLDQAWKYYLHAFQCSNDLGLFSEEFDPSRGAMLGNFPQGLTHISQIRARLALEKCSNSKNGAGQNWQVFSTRAK